MAKQQQIVLGESFKSDIKALSEEEISKLFVYPEPIDAKAVTPGYVYVIVEWTTDKQSHTGLYKVGKTVNPNKRISDLQTGNARELGFIRATKVKDITAAEQAAHTALATYRVNYGGGTEWFKTNDLNKFVTIFDKAVKPYE